MSNVTLKTLFPAGGVSSNTIEILNIKKTSNADVLAGLAILPATTEEQKVVIYHVVNELGQDDYRAISAFCPHQGADITRDELKHDGNVYCSLHKRPICIFSKFNQAFAVEKIDDKYFIIATE